MWSSTTPNLRIFSYVWTIYQTTNGSTSNFCLGQSTPSYLFQYFFEEIVEIYRAQILSCYGPKVSVLLTLWTIFQIVQLYFLVLSTSLWTQLRLPHPSIASILWCMCTHLINWVSTFYVALMATSARKPIM
jgi:hypothetical protein